MTPTEFPRGLRGNSGRLCAAMKPHPLLTATMPLVLTKEMELAIVRRFIERERLRTRKLKRSDRHPKRYKIIKIVQLPE